MEDYKQKYEHALDNFKKIKAANKDNKELVDFIEYEYPELKESEDEKMRKMIIQVINITPATIARQYRKEMLDWLEKQVEKKVDKCEGCNNVKGCITCTDGDQYAHITEQKPADKVEPKSDLEKGKWYVCNTPRYRDFVVGKAYYCPKNGMLKPNENAMARYVARHCFHLWTIQDAKEGDVLYYKSPSGIEYIVMSSGVNRFGNVDSYFRYNSVDGFGISVPSVFNTKEDITPATKEQRDLLFTKMKEAGYKWDAEKKELKKIEQKSTWSEKDEKFIDNLCNLLVANSKNNYIGSSYTPDLVVRLQALKALKQKSTWSEEDKGNLLDVYHG